MSALEREFAHERPASHLRRGWHVQFTGRWWLVECADEAGPVVEVTLSPRVGAVARETTRFGRSTPLWTRMPGEQIMFAAADERRRREEILDAAVARIGSAMALAGVAA